MVVSSKYSSSSAKDDSSYEISPTPKVPPSWSPLLSYKARRHAYVEAGAGGDNLGFIYAEFLIPADFSEMIKSGKPGAATIELYANSKNNFMSTLLASQVEKRIEESLSQQISERTVQAMLQSIIQRQGESPYVSALAEGTMAAFISNPVDSKVIDMEGVPNYGTGFAPYFTSLSLWIGALLISMVVGFRFGKDDKKWKQTNSFNAVVGRFFVFACVGVLQALLLTLTVKILGIQPQNWLMVFLSFVIGSMTSIAIITMLVSLLGKIGQLLSMVVLIFQLSSSGGTFPLELTSTNIFTSIHPFVPFTYSIQALKEALSGNPINFGVYWQSLATLVLFMVICLTICVLLRRPCETFMDKTSAPQKEATSNS